MKGYSVLSIYLCVLMSLGAMPKAVSITWKQLGDVRFDRKLNKKLNMYFLYPTFGNTVKSLEKKEIEISGYMIPIDEFGERYVISANPMAACFFCGGAGPESIIELQFKNRYKPFKTDDFRKIRGKLCLNSDDIEHLNYILKNAEVIK